MPYPPQRTRAALQKSPTRSQWEVLVAARSRPGYHNLTTPRSLYQIWTSVCLSLRDLKRKVWCSKELVQHPWQMAYPKITKEHCSTIHHAICHNNDLGCTLLSLPCKETQSPWGFMRCCNSLQVHSAYKPVFNWYLVFLGRVRMVLTSFVFIFIVKKIIYSHVILSLLSSTCLRYCHAEVHLSLEPNC